MTRKFVLRSALVALHPATIIASVALFPAQASGAGAATTAMISDSQIEGLALGA